MSASRDEKTGKWTAQCYYENWKGEKKHKKKRGFATKKEALEWEREFLKSTSANMDMMLGAFVDVYFWDKAGELKERTIKNKGYSQTYLRMVQNQITALFTLLSVKLDAPVPGRLVASDLDFTCRASADCLPQHLQVI